MNVFDAVKQSVTTKQTAEMYGLKIRRNNMTSCPFHNDKTPSMKVDKRFYPNLNKIQTFIHKC